MLRPELAANASGLDLAELTDLATQLFQSVEQTNQRECGHTRDQNRISESRWITDQG